MKKIIAAVHTDEDFNLAIQSKTDMIFDLSPNILTLKNRVKTAHANGKLLFIHIDLAEGIGKDRFGMLYAKELGVDGIISTRSGMIKTAKEVGLKSVQRFFAVDSQSVDTIKSLNALKADMIEIMPGIVSKVIKNLQKEVSLPIIAGGLIETPEEMQEAYRNGAVAISTGKPMLWRLCK